MAADSELPRQYVAGHVRLSALLLQQMAQLHNVIANNNNGICFCDAWDGLVENVLDTTLKDWQFHLPHFARVF